MFSQFILSPCSARSIWFRAFKSGFENDIFVLHLRIFLPYTHLKLMIMQQRKLMFDYITKINKVTVEGFYFLLKTFLGLAMFLERTTEL